ncbi:hypothetical protein [Kangiella sp. M94]
MLGKILVTSLLILSFNLPVKATPFLVGTWKSNEELTVQSMERTIGIPEKSREAFRNDFFGKLTIKVKKNTFSAYFDGKQLELDMEYEVTKINNNSFLIKSYSKQTEDITEQKITIEGDCYYTLVSDWQFREYFCRQ